MSRYVSIVELHLSPDHQADYLAAANALIRQCRSDPNLVSHQVHVDPTDPCHCLVTHEWLTEDAFQEHYRQPHLTAFLTETSAYTKGPVSVRLFEVEKSQTLI